MKIKHFAPSTTQWMLANQNEETPLSEQVERSTLKKNISSYEKWVLAHLNFTERPLWNSETFIATFNLWSTLVFNIFWNFHRLHYVKFKVMPFFIKHHYAWINHSILLTVQDFSSINIVSSRKEVVACLDLFFYQKKCLYKWEERKRSSTIFV